MDEAEAEEEAEWVCRILEGYPVSYPVVYNCEGFQEETSRQYGMTVEERTALACVFLDRIEEAGYTGMFYAARSELEDSLFWDTETLEQRYRIWVAQYLPEAYPEIQGLEYGGSNGRDKIRKECAQKDHPISGLCLAGGNMAYTGLGGENV